MSSNPNSEPSSDDVRSLTRLRFFYLLTHEIAKFFTPAMTDLRRILTLTVEDVGLKAKATLDSHLRNKINKIKTFVAEIKDWEHQNGLPIAETQSNCDVIENMPEKFKAALGEYFEDSATLTPQQRRVLSCLRKHGVYTWLHEVLDGFVALTVQLNDTVLAFLEQLSETEQQELADLLSLFAKFIKQKDGCKKMKLLAKFYELDYD